MAKSKLRRKIGCSTALLLLIAAVVFIAMRWHVWFYNPEEEPYHTPNVPQRVLLTFGNEDELSRNISWQCGEEVQDSWAEVNGKRIKATGEVFKSRAGKGAYYVVRLRNLAPDSTYRYRVVTANKTSEYYTFTTQAKGAHPFEFLFVGDVQDTIGGKANQYLREAISKHPKTEFLISGGDLTERPIDKYWGETFRGIDSIAQTMPVLCVTGNHDYLKGVINQLERRFTLIFSYFLDSKIWDNQVYTLRYGDAQFFLLDSNRELPHLLTQRFWLDWHASRSKARWKVLVLHHPLHSLKGRINNLFQRWCFDDIVRDHGFDLVLQGHEHAYGRMTVKNDDGSATTPVYTVSHCSPKNYKIDPGDRFDRIGREGRYYQTIRIGNDTLAMSAYSVYDHSLFDSVMIIKKTDRSAPSVIEGIR